MIDRRRALLLAATTLALALPGPVLAGTTVYWADASGNGRADTFLVDDTFDGRADRMLIDPTEDGYAESWATLDAYGRITAAYFDGNQNGRNEQVFQKVYLANGGTANHMWTDGNEDGRYENEYWDWQGDGIYEQVAVDTNFDGYADTWRTSVAPASGTAGYTPAHWASWQGANAIYAAYGICVFYCGS